MFSEASMDSDSLGKWLLQLQDNNDKCRCSQGTVVGFVSMMIILELTRYFAHLIKNLERVGPPQGINNRKNDLKLSELHLVNDMKSSNHCGSSVSRSQQSTKGVEEESLCLGRNYLVACEGCKTDSLITLCGRNFCVLWQE